VGVGCIGCPDEDPGQVVAARVDLKQRDRRRRPEQAVAEDGLVECTRKYPVGGLDKVPDPLRRHLVVAEDVASARRSSSVCSWNWRSVASLESTSMPMVAGPQACQGNVHARPGVAGNLGW
jgi:hypothetical protein